MGLGLFGGLSVTKILARSDSDAGNVIWISSDIERHTCQVDAVAKVRIIIENLSDITLAYNSSAAVAATQFCRRLAEDLTTCAFSESSVEGVLEADVRLLNLSGWPLGDDRDAQALMVEQIAELLSATPMTWGAETFHLKVACAIVASGPEAIEVAARSGGCRLSDSEAVDGVRRESFESRYQADMTLFGRLWQQIDSRRARLRWRAISGVVDPVELFSSGHLHADLANLAVWSDGSGSTISAVSAADRLGLRWLVDQFAVGSALRRLDVDPFACVGISLARSSLVSRLGWREALCHLSANRGLATRLFVELEPESGATAPGVDLPVLSALRQHGCRIVQTDFGMGDGSLRDALRFKPDAIALSPMLLHAALQGGALERVYARTAALARELAPIVIGDGVECERETELLRSAGVAWRRLGDAALHADRELPS